MAFNAHLIQMFHCPLYSCFISVPVLFLLQNHLSDVAFKVKGHYLQRAGPAIDYFIQFHRNNAERSCYDHILTLMSCLCMHCSSVEGMVSIGYGHRGMASGP